MSTSEAKVVTLHYELRKDGPEGEVIESVEQDKPVSFLLGAGRLIEKFEKNIADLNAGDPFEFTLEADQAYGAVNEAAIIDLPKNVFEIDGKMADELLQEGKFINMEDQQGNSHRGKVVSIGDETVKMDFNHPMAGVTLHFKGTVNSMREATEEEISHGHAHTGEGGH
jgi:FKBP-type peptidyl-prolyl cis-trans isomerase SlyD